MKTVPNTPESVHAAFCGVVPAMVTPCSAPGVPDPAAAERLARILTTEGCHGLFVLGSTGELPLLDEPVRRELTRAVCAGAVGESVVYAGVSGTGIAQTVRYAKNAAEDGADVAIAMAPFFLKADQDNLFDYIRRIADESPIPVGIYNHFRMPAVFEIETVLRLAQHPNIVAIKDSSAEPERGRELARLLSDQPISFFQGREPFLLDSFGAGAAGCVTALANFSPALHRKFYEALRGGDMEQARECQNSVDELARIFQIGEIAKSFAFFAYAIKRAVQELGWIDHAFGLMPGFKGSETMDAEIRKLLKEVGLLPRTEPQCLRRYAEPGFEPPSELNSHLAAKKVYPIC